MNFPLPDPGPILDWDRLLREARSLYEEADPGHDFSHILRVFENARRIGEQEGADMQVLLLAALLHDAGSPPKSAGPQDRSRAG
ncbi:MAG: HD domain-containing protein [Methanosarcinales archaeon]|nr:HD domain-containing protein [Methanosarcinales archaeon]